MKLTLASGSPRRRDLLTWAGWQVVVRPQDIDETWTPGTDPVEHALALASGKAASAVASDPDPPLVLAADTVVHLGVRIFDKPQDRDQAAAHLTALSGRTHRVTTGVCLAGAGRQPLPFHVTTKVRFRTLSSIEIAAYLETGEADDKAGAYGIQGRGGALVAEVHGSWTNVMGLPLERTLAALAEWPS